MTDKQYDLVILDVGRGISGIPEHLVTQNFFQQIEHHIKKDGIFIANYFISIMMDDPFTQSLDATIRSVFPHVNRQIMSGYNPWDIAENQHASVLYISRKRVTPYLRIYTDNTNRSSLEKPAKAAY